MKHALVGLFLAIVYFLILLVTLPDYGMNQDSPGKFLRGQTYLQVLTTGSDHFEQPELPSPVYFYPGQRISLTKLSTAENHTAPVTSIESFDGTTRQEIFARYLRNNSRQSLYKHNAFIAREGSSRFVWVLGYPSTIGKGIRSRLSGLRINPTTLFSWDCPDARG